MFSIMEYFSPCRPDILSAGYFPKEGGGDMRHCQIEVQDLCGPSTKLEFGIKVFGVPNQFLGIE